jgi:MFS family permease
MLVTRFGYTFNEAGAYIPIPVMVLACMGPLLGYFLDRTGHRLTIMNFSCVLLIITQIIDLLAPDCVDECSYPVIILVCQGVCMSFCAAINFGSVIAFTVEPSMFGRGFGVAAAFNNIL